VSTQTPDRPAVFLSYSHGACREVRERAEQTLEWLTTAARDILSATLDHLSLGRAHLGLALTPPGEKAEADFAKAAEHLDHGARLCRQRGDQEGLERHVARARTLVEETGCGRRAREVAWLGR
jgi:hypothetical protein